MEFLKDRSFKDLTTTSRLLKNIQKYYFHIFIALYNELLTAAIPSSDFPELYETTCDKVKSSHALTRCYMTRVLLNVFFLKKNATYVETLPDISKASWRDALNVDVTTVSFTGPIFPDHTLIFLRTGDEFYILQSYYYAYMITGKYGAIKLSKTEAEAFLHLLTQYKAYEGKEYSPEDAIRIFDLNKMMQKYTGINAQKHFVDFSKIEKPNIREKNYVYIQTSKTEYSNFLLNTYKKIELITKRIKSVFFDEGEHNLTLPFEYRFYDAFNEAEVAKDPKKFEYLVGHSYETGIEGIRTGHSISYERVQGTQFTLFYLSYEVSVPERIVEGELKFLLDQILFYLKEYVPVYFMTGILPEPQKVRYQKLQFRRPF